MRPRARWLLAILSALSPLGAAEVEVQGATLAQLWKQTYPGFHANSYTTATQFLGVDATELGSERFSFHLFGWGYRDLADQSRPDGKGGGDLTYGYFRYRFPVANADLKLGRQVVSAGSALEQIDGLSGRTDLRGGFTLSFFGGKPVLIKTLEGAVQQDYDNQRNLLAGGRLSWRAPRVFELGLSYLQDGRSPTPDAVMATQTDYSRKQGGLDIRITPTAYLDLSGRTLFNLKDRQDLTAGVVDPSTGSRLAEHDYALTVKFAPRVTFTSNYTERNFRAYYAGSTLPSLFNPQDTDKQRAFGGSLTLGNASGLSAVVDFRHTKRETYGTANRLGADLRWTQVEAKVQLGCSYHRVSASDAPVGGTAAPQFGLSHHELRAWVLRDDGTWTLSLDGLLHRYDDKENPNLNGRATAYELIGSAGYHPWPELGFSGDISYGANALWTQEVRGLLRAEYRFNLKQGAKP